MGAHVTDAANGSRDPSAGRDLSPWLALLLYTLLSAIVTWPLLAHFGSRLGGDLTDPWQTYWGFWWWRHARALGGSPMHTPLLWWPDGVSLWFQTWDVPSAVAVWPLWGHLPDFALYNLPLFASFPLAGVTCYLLCRELWGSALAAFLAGCLYTFSTFHFGQAIANLHIVSMQWSPLYVLGLIRTLRRPGYGGPILGGVGLALAALASTYHLIFCLAATALWLAFEWGTAETMAVARGIVPRVIVLVAIFLAMAGWLFAGMWHAYRTEPYTGAHDAVVFSADLQSFFLPNAASAWRNLSGAWHDWTGSAWASAGYFGYVALGLAIAAAWRVRAARAFLFVALMGAYLALGPYLHIGGAIHSKIVMPYAWLAWLVPPLQFGGIPSRFSWLATFGLAVAAGAVLAELARRGRPGRAAAIALVALSLVETWPRPFVTSVWPSPPIMMTWAADATPWAVIDATAWPRALWHQTLHHHPMLAGYVSRAPERLWDGIRASAVAPLYPPPIGPAATPDPPSIDIAAARRELAALDVRYVIEDEDKTAAAEQLGLSAAYRGDGIVIYRVR